MLARGKFVCLVDVLLCLFLRQTLLLSGRWKRWENFVFCSQAAKRSRCGSRNVKEREEPEGPMCGR